MVPASRRGEPVMIDLQSVSDLLTARHPTAHGNPGRIVAMTKGRAIDLAQLRRDVAVNTRSLRATWCKRGLLLADDTYWAAVGMLALFQAGA